MSNKIKITHPDSI